MFVTDAAYELRERLLQGADGTLREDELVLAEQLRTARLLEPGVRLGHRPGEGEVDFARRRRMLTIACALSASAGLVATVALSRSGELDYDGLVPAGVPGVAIATYLLLGLVLALAHEAGHGVASVLLGARGARLRLTSVSARLLLATRVSGSWLLPRWDRALVSLAGPAVSAGGGALLALASGVATGTARTVLVHTAFAVLLTGWLSLFPFVKADGYYVMSHLSDTPNLAERGLRRLVAVLRGRARPDFVALFGALYAVAVAATSTTTVAVGVVLTAQGNWPQAVPFYAWVVYLLVQWRLRRRAAGQPG